MTDPVDPRVAYRLNRMERYGLCELCHGPRTPCWDVYKDEDRLEVSMASMCIDCGWGDPTYRAPVTGTF